MPSLATFNANNFFLGGVKLWEPKRFLDRKTPQINMPGVTDRACV